MKYSKAYDFYYADREDYKKKKNEKLRVIPTKNGMKYSRTNDFWYTDRKDYYQKMEKIGKTKDYRLKIYGINEAQKQQMILEQDNKCLRCGLPFGSNRSDAPVVDHDHSYEDGDPNSIRGILHLKCNTLIGVHNDSIEELEKSITYLKKFEKVKNFSKVV